jgi:lipopolysaccharide transport system ATP-binding protein
MGEDYWALRGLSFEVPRGQVLGVIGRNGAGKSTLFKILSRITPPSEGTVQVRGRVGSLLEVGTGFHPELTGRENIFLNGSILGMKVREIHGKFEAIVNFAAVEDFIDTPVKRYSSGMYVRLAFSVAAHLGSEILLVDEVLAVGDQDFQARCVKKMRDVVNEGRTILLVSHNRSTIMDLADCALVLEAGAVGFHGEVERALEHYEAGSSRSEVDVVLSDLRREDRWLTGEVALSHARLELAGGQAEVRWGDNLNVFVALVGRSAVRVVFLTLVIRDSDGVSVGVCESDSIGAPRAGESLELTCVLPSLKLRPGRYSIDLILGNGPVVAGRVGVDIDKVKAALKFELSPMSLSGVTVGRWWQGFGTVNLGDLAIVASCTKHLSAHSGT